MSKLRALTALELAACQPSTAVQLQHLAAYTALKSFKLSHAGSGAQPCVLAAPLHLPLGSRLQVLSLAYIEGGVCSTVLTAWPHLVSLEVQYTLLLDGLPGVAAVMQAVAHSSRAFKASPCVVSDFRRAQQQQQQPMVLLLMRQVQLCP